MKHHGGILLMGFLLFSGVMSSLTAQTEAGRLNRERDEAPLFVDALSFASASTDSSRLTVFMQVGYSMLSFIKNGTMYDASYEMTLSLLDSTEALVREFLWTDHLRGVSFEKTSSTSLASISQRHFVVMPGSYILKLLVRDMESGTSHTVSRELVVPNFAAGEFMLSDIMLLSRVSSVGGKVSIAPSISPNIGAIPDSFFVYVEAYNRANVDSTEFSIDILGKKSEKPITLDTLVIMKPGRNECILRIPHGALPIGDYNLVIGARPVAVPRTDDEHYLASTSRPVIVRWYGLPRSIMDLDVAIEQLKYIAKDSEMSSMRDAAGPEAKMAAFNEFWKKRDPNPSTPRNEKMEEYFARVDYANKNFSHYIEGWRTDRGMVFIMFGPPNNIDRHPFDVNAKPYEIWSYYELNYSFVFVDQTGFGDYRLETPLWEVWNRMRN
jgi:GWxTD domain-containing protein